MNTISESVNHWRTPTQVAVADSPVPATETALAGEDPESDGFQVFGGDGFTFLDFIDIINPLQHIPFVGSMYRDMTGDTLDAGSRVLGSTLFFGPVGTVASIANVMIEDSTGMDMGDHVLAMFEDAPDKPPVDANRPAATGPQRVADAGSRSMAPGVDDPVTAWARSEIAFRNSAAGKARPLTMGQAPAPAPVAADAVAERDTAAWTATWAAGTEQALLSPAEESRARSPVSDTAAWTATWAAGTEQAKAAVAAARTPKPTAAAGDTAAWTATWAAGTEQALLSPGAESRPRAPSTRQSALTAATLARDARAGAQLFAANTYTAGQSAAAKRVPDRNAAATSGAIAPGGGWFSQSPAAGHAEYRSGTGLTSEKRPAVLDLTR